MTMTERATNRRPAFGRCQGQRAHCEHIAGAVFQVDAGPDQAAVGSPAICCHCGRVRVVYQGPQTPAGHGPYVEVGPASSGRLIDMLDQRQGDA